MVDVPLTGYRLVEVLYGDTLQSIAARELGDAERWAELIAINGLTWPYLTSDENESSATVKLYGQTIFVPAATPQVSATSDPDAVFGVDLLLVDGDLEAVDGDLELVGGRFNLRQALKHRIDTPLGDLIFHQAYGCGAHRLKGRAASPTTALLGARYVRDAVQADPRVDSVIESTATVVGDVVQANANVRPVVGAAVAVSTEG